MFNRIRGVFGPGETQNERLLREAGLDAAERPPRQEPEDEPLDALAHHYGSDGYAAEARRLEAATFAVTLTPL